MFGVLIVASLSFVTLSICRQQNGWTRIQRTPSHHGIQVQIALRQSNFEQLERHLEQGKVLES